MSTYLILPSSFLAWTLAASCLAADTLGGLGVVVVNALSPQASDANDGSAAAPLKTILRAATLVQPGGVVLIHTGVYREAVVIERSGTAQRPIRFEAAPGAEVVVTGADLLRDLHQEPAAPGERVYSVPWPHRFIEWSRTGTHPDDDYHKLIGRAEQVIVDGYLLRQVLDAARLERGTFQVDFGKRRLLLQASSNAALGDDRHHVEASVRGTIWDVKGDYVHTRGITFRYAANAASQGMVVLRGRGDTIEDCRMEWSNACGLELFGAEQTVRRCTLQYNGQEAFAAAGAHQLLVTGTVVRQNNLKNFDREWEAGGLKIGLSRDVVLEHSEFAENRGNGIWFDMGNENCTVRNNLIARNEDAGIFYEISYGLQAHDNVIVGNGLSDTAGAWGACGGVSLSSSPGCTVERNLFLGNKEGLQFREQERTTARIGHDPGTPEVWTWNHDEIVRNNIFAHSRDTHIAGWFDVADERHLPAAQQRRSAAGTQSRPKADAAARFGAKSRAGRPAGLNLESLKLRLEDNVFYGAAANGLWAWGVPWRSVRYYASVEDVRDALQIAPGRTLAALPFADPRARDFRLPAGSPAFLLACYPRGDVPGVRLGVVSRP